MFSPLDLILVIISRQYIRLLGTSLVVNFFDRTLSKKDRRALIAKQKTCGTQMVKRVKKNGKEQVTGRPPLKWSMHYPQEFCTTILHSWEKLQEKVSGAALLSFLYSLGLGGASRGNAE